MPISTADRRLLTGQLATRDRSWDDGWSMTDWLPNPDPVLKALGTDISTYRDLRADAHIGGCIRRRKAAIRTLEPGLERAGSPARLHRAVQDMLKDLWATPDPDEAGAQPGLAALIAESLDGALYGYQPHEITWGRVGSLLVPQVVQGKPPEWFHFDADNQLRFRSHDHGMDGELLPPRKFLLSRQDPTYHNPYGVADLAACFWPGTFKRAGLKFWTRFVEKYGGAFLVGKLPRTNPAADYADLVARLSVMINDAVAVIPDDGSVEVLTSTGTAASTDAHLRFLLYCQGQIAMALLGSNQGTEQTSTVASATAALEVADDIRDGDARMVEAVVNQLIRWFVEMNWPGSPAPCWELRAAEKIDTTLAQRDKLLAEAGVTFTAAYWQRAYDLEEGDLETVSPAASDPAIPPTPPTPPVALAAPGATALRTAADGPDAIDQLTDRLSREARPAIQAMVEQVRTMAETAGSLEELATMLEAAYPQVDAGPLAATMRQALLAARLGGMAEVADEG